MARMKLKILQQYLDGVDTFENPKLKLEQYATPPHIAACMLYTIQSSYGDIEDKSVADLGCGCGVLSVGCSLLGSAFVVGLDIDSEALAVASRNIRDVECDAFDGVVCDVTMDDFQDGFHKRFDVVVMNPPFGTKNNRGVDMLFLKAGLKLATDSVYSLHKTSTREHVLRKAASWGVKAEVLAELKYNLTNSYKFHKKTSVDINVDLLRFCNLDPV